MRRLVMTAVVSVALSIPATTAIGLSGTAGAKAVPPTPTAGSSVVCTKLKYKSKTKKGVTTSSISFSKCYNNAGKLLPPNKALGSNNPAALQTGGPLTWSTSGLITMTGAGTLVVTPGGCPGGATEYTSNGAVVAGTTQPLTPVGDLTSGSVCVTGVAPNVTLTLAPGTFFEL